MMPRQHLTDSLVSVAVGEVQSVRLAIRNGLVMVFSGPAGVADITALHHPIGTRRHITVN
jgi:hypothetical protein